MRRTLSPVYFKIRDYVNSTHGKIFHKSPEAQHKNKNKTNRTEARFDRVYYS